MRPLELALARRYNTESQAFATLVKLWRLLRGAQCFPEGINAIFRLHPSLLLSKQRLTGLNKAQRESALNGLA